MLSLFDVYELMPRTDCGKCTYGSCIKMAEQIAKGKADVSDCSVIAGGENNIAAAIKKLMEEENN